MRKILLFLCLIALALGLPIQADAAGAAQSISIYATVAPDQSCQVSITITLQADPGETLRFPLTSAAEQVALNGNPIHCATSSGLKYVTLPNTPVATITYTLHDVIHVNDTGLWELRLPLLSGFAYPVQALEFSVTLPGNVRAKPAFSSGYHQANIEKDLYFYTSGATVIGIAQTELKDHETLAMTLTVPEEMFPPSLLTAPDYQTVSILIVIFTLLALLYWILFLRNAPFWPVANSTPPDGCSAGDLGSLLHLHRGKLSLMIFSWAQLGYLLIQSEPGGRVLLHKQMDMGNECSGYEQRCFKLLFGKYPVVDTEGLRYSEVCRVVSKMRPNLSHMIHRRSGSLFLFRLLTAMAGFFCGAHLGISFSSANHTQLWIWVLLMGTAAFCTSWYIHGCICFTAGKRRLWHALLLGILWMLLGLVANSLLISLCLALGQFIAGLLTSFGGRRTPAGRQIASEILGLRRYLKNVSPAQLQHICQYDPEYFHRMMPYAIALGVDEPFSHHFSGLSVGTCPYLHIGAPAEMDAAQWRSILMRVFRTLNAHENHALANRLSGVFRLFIR